MVAHGPGAFRPDLISWRPGCAHSMPLNSSGVGPLYQLKPVDTSPGAMAMADIVARCVEQAAAEYGVPAQQLYRAPGTVTGARARIKAAHLLSCEFDGKGGRLYSPTMVANLLSFNSGQAAFAAVKNAGYIWGHR